MTGRQRTAESTERKKVEIILKNPTEKGNIRKLRVRSGQQVVSYKSLKKLILIRFFFSHSRFIHTIFFLLTRPFYKKRTIIFKIHNSLIRESRTIIVQNNITLNQIYVYLVQNICNE